MGLTWAPWALPRTDFGWHAAGALAPYFRPGRSGEFPGAPFLSPEPGQGGAGWALSGSRCPTPRTSRSQASSPKGVSISSPRPACHSPLPAGGQWSVVPAFVTRLPPRPITPARGCGCLGRAGSCSPRPPPLPSQTRDTREDGGGNSRSSAQGPKGSEGVGLPSHRERGARAGGQGHQPQAPDLGSYLGGGWRRGLSRERPRVRWVGLRPLGEGPQVSGRE